jgi:small subunit ribosomal protein S17
MSTQIIVGKVVSVHGDKTAIIAIDRRMTHPIYKKQYTKTDRFMIHDENNELGVGDVVEARATRKLSKNKSWSLSRVIEKGQEDPALNEVAS